MNIIKIVFSGYMSMSLDSLPSKSTKSADVRSSQVRYASK